MEDVPLAAAKQNLEDLIERASRGEDVRIVGPDAARIRLVRDSESSGAQPERKPGRWRGRLPQEPDDFFDPLPESELQHWYGDSQ